MLSIVFLLAASLSGFAMAQNSSANGQYTIDPNSVSSSLKGSWCQAQHNSCLQLCNNIYMTNTCDQTTLQYQCTCQNGQSPNLTGYEATIPFFECQTYQMQCINATTQDNQAQQKCVNINCGSKSPASAQSSLSAAAASSTMMPSGTGSMSTSATPTSAGGAAASSTSTSPPSAGNTVSVSGIYGTAIFAMVALVTFGMAL